MSRKRTVYSTEFKTKLVFEVLKGDNTLNEIVSKNNVTPKNLIIGKIYLCQMQSWRWNLQKRLKSIR